MGSNLQTPLGGTKDFVVHIEKKEKFQGAINYGYLAI